MWLHMEVKKTVKHVKDSGWTLQTGILLTVSRRWRWCLVGCSFCYTCFKSILSSENPFQNSLPPHSPPFLLPSLFLSRAFTFWSSLLPLTSLIWLKLEQTFHLNSFYFCTKKEFTPLSLSLSLTSSLSYSLAPAVSRSTDVCPSVVLSLLFLLLFFRSFCSLSLSLSYTFYLSLSLFFSHTHPHTHWQVGKSCSQIHIAHMISVIESKDLTKNTSGTTGELMCGTAAQWLQLKSFR